MMNRNATMNENDAKMAKRTADFEDMLNSPMRWYHKLPYWIVLGLICFVHTRIIA
jgi:hypothetical protein